MIISKSDYMLFLKHPAWLWLKKHDKTKLPPVDDNLQSVFDAGHLFESYAEQLFPDIVRLGFNGYNEYLSLPACTKLAIESKAKVFSQGRFEVENITCIFDLIVRVEGNTFDLYEIKSSTSAKLEHEYDLAFQVVVLENAGLKINRVAVIHVNNQYVRKGEIDAKEITTVVDITDKVRSKIDETKINIQKALDVAELDESPSISPRFASSSFGDWMAVYKFINSDMDKYSIYNLAALKASIIGEFEDLGIDLIKDIPESFKLSTKQSQQRITTRNGDQILDIPQIRKFLDGLTYPLYFLDYETLGSFLPPFDGMKPYQQLPFQYSLHILDTPGGKLRHLEYLHLENSNPARALSESLKSNIGDKGSVIVWNESFEKSCNDLLGELLPEFSSFFDQVNKRIVDLMLPFSSGWFVDKDFYGSASLKNVLPALISELSYKDLNIQGGETAQRLWMDAVLGGNKKIDKESLFKDLLQYCGLDTLAMVKIYEVLQKVMEKNI